MVCPGCRRGELIQWAETVTVIEPPHWWRFPRHYWPAPTFEVESRLCASCGWKRETDVR